MPDDTADQEKSTEPERSTGPSQERSLQARIDELVEEILETDRTPEEVCAQRPDLLALVREELRKLSNVEGQLNSLFPNSLERVKSRVRSSAMLEGVFPSIPEYVVQKVLGRGGMGIVYHARHLQLKRDVALKMLLSGSYASRRDHLRFLREAESSAALRHPNIIQVYDIGEVDGHPYYTMEYISGGTLAEQIAGGMQPARDSAKLVAALARAVQAAHESGIVHRDLKPANILMTTEGLPKISDFGLARWLDRESSLTNTGARIGTPSYMAPEQLRGGAAAAGPAVDHFALGAILYEMLTGHPPFRAETVSDTERKLATEEAEPPSRFNSKVPRDLEVICLKCLEKAPQARYASAGDLADDLERFLRHEPIYARPVAPGERLIRWIRRHPLPAALTVAFLVLVGLIGSQVVDNWAKSAASRVEKARLTSRFETGIQLVQEGRFAEAHAILGRLGDGGFSELRQRIDRALADLDLVEKLDEIGVVRATLLNADDPAWHPKAQAAKEYESLFASSGIGKMTDEPAAIARSIGASEIKQPLIAALDDWAVCEREASRRNWVLEVARLGGAPDQEWENRCRNPATWTDRTQLLELCNRAPNVKASVQQLRALGDRLALTRLDATAFRLRVQAGHVDHFLANLSLADELSSRNPAEAIRYYQAAIAVRPRSATAHHNLGVALARLNRLEEAIQSFNRALTFDAKSVATHFQLGMALRTKRPLDAIQELQTAIQLNENFAVIHQAYGELLLKEHRLREAAQAFQSCLKLSKDETQREQVSQWLKQCETPPAK